MGVIYHCQVMEVDELEHSKDVPGHDHPAPRFHHCCVLLLANLPPPSPSPSPRLLPHIPPTPLPPTHPSRLPPPLQMPRTPSCWQSPRTCSQPWPARSATSRQPRAACPSPWASSRLPSSPQPPPPPSAPPPRPPPPPPPPTSGHAQHVVWKAVGWPAGFVRRRGLYIGGQGGCVGGGEWCLSVLLVQAAGKGRCVCWVYGL